LAIDPSDLQAQDFMAQDLSRPVIFLNLHKYYDDARYPTDYDDRDLPAGVSGQEAYHRYLWRVEHDFMPQVGGRFLLVGPVDLVFIGAGDWDEVVIGEYPSAEEAIRMPTLPGYEDIAVHRIAGLKEAMTLKLTQEKLDRIAVPDAWVNRD
jgi:uncharacterized protein (DUF1330 family)